MALGSGGVLEAMRPGSIFLDHTTVSAQHVDTMREACAAHDIRYAEAPMTRTPKHADAGQVNILFGGEGLFLATLTGPGRIWLQSLPLSNLASKLLQYMPMKNG